MCTYKSPHTHHTHTTPYKYPHTMHKHPHTPYTPPTHTTPHKYLQQTLSHTRHTPHTLSYFLYTHHTSQTPATDTITHNTHTPHIHSYFLSPGKEHRIGAGWGLETRLRNSSLQGDRQNNPTSQTQPGHRLLMTDLIVHNRQHKYALIEWLTISLLRAKHDREEVYSPPLETRFHRCPNLRKQKGPKPSWPI